MRAALTTTDRPRGPARTLAIFSGGVAVVQWVVFVPLLAMGTVDADRAYVAFVAAAFFGWPLLGVAAFTGAVLVERRPRAALVLLLIAGAGLIFPFFVGGVLAFIAAALVFRSRPGWQASSGPAGWPKVKDVSRAVGIGVIAVIAGAVLIPTILSLSIRFRSSGDDSAIAGLPAGGAFLSPDEALRNYAEAWEAPFVGQCPATGETGTCVQSEEKSAGRITYRICAVSIDACTDVEVASKSGSWAVTDVEGPGPEP